MAFAHSHIEAKFGNSSRQRQVNKYKAAGALIVSGVAENTSRSLALSKSHSRAHTKDNSLNAAKPSCCTKKRHARRKVVCGQETTGQRKLGALGAQPSQQNSPGAAPFV
jgi:hypothetical protein